jgi:hypothetical protein
MLFSSFFDLIHHNNEYLRVSFYSYRIRGDGLSDIKEDLAFLESPRRVTDEVGHRGLYEHERNKMCGTFFRVEASKAEKKLTSTDPQMPRRR